MGPRRQGGLRDWHVNTFLKIKATGRYSALARFDVYYKELTTASKQAFYLILFDRARALGVEVKIWYPTEITFTSIDAYRKTFIFSDDELAQLEELKKDASSYIQPPHL